MDKDGGNKIQVNIEKTHGILIIIFYVNPISPQLERISFLYQKHKKTPLFSKWLIGIH